VSGSITASAVNQRLPEFSGVQGGQGRANKASNLSSWVSVPCLAIALHQAEALLGKGGFSSGVLIYKATARNKLIKWNIPNKYE
jgi:hypothetical protein